MAAGATSAFSGVAVSLGADRGVGDGPAARLRPVAIHAPSIVIDGRISLGMRRCPVADIGDPFIAALSVTALRRIRHVAEHVGKSLPVDPFGYHANPQPVARAGPTVGVEHYDAGLGSHDLAPRLGDLLLASVIEDDRSGGASCVGPARLDRKSTRLNSSHTDISRMPSSA